MAQSFPTPVERSVITEILNVARRSPSGVNTQPWLVRVLMNPAATGLFPGAACVLAFSIERVLALGSQLDSGMFVGSVAMAANARQLATHINTDLGDARASLETALHIPDTELLLCVMTLQQAADTTHAAQGDKLVHVTWLA